MKTLLIYELKALLEAVAKHSDSHFIEIESDLQQAAFLLNEAIEKLSRDFMAIHSELIAQQNMIQQLSAQGELSQTAKENLSVFENNIGALVNSVVTGMQFQDMTNQLLERTIKRVTGLRELLDDLATTECQLADVEQSETLLRYLANVNQQLENNSQYLLGNLRKSVGQSNLNSGDIDLF